MKKIYLKKEKNSELISILQITLSQLLNQLIHTQTMVIKIQLIKPKNKNPPTFYKTSQIKFQSLSLPIKNRFRARSSPKILRYNNPWELMTNQQIDTLAARLQDKPEQLYDVVKQNQRQRSKQDEISKRLKFNKLNFAPQRLPSSLNKTIQPQKLFLQSPKNKKTLQKNYSQTSLLNLSNHNRILAKLNLKKQEYERQMRNMIQDKRLILETDLPKIGKIGIAHESKTKLRLNSTQKSNKLPLWKMR